MDALANWSGSILGSARVPRAGEGVPPSRTFLVVRNLNMLMSQGKVRFGETPKPALCKSALPRRLLRWPPIDLLAMPRLRNVLHPWLADVIHQHKGQRICIWPAELIRARAFAIFGDFP